MRELRASTRGRAWWGPVALTLASLLLPAGCLNPRTDDLPASSEQPQPGAVSSQDVPAGRDSVPPTSDAAEEVGAPDPPPPQVAPESPRLDEPSFGAENSGADDQPDAGAPAPHDSAADAGASGGD